MSSVCINTWEGTQDARTCCWSVLWIFAEKNNCQCFLSLYDWKSSTSSASFHGVVPERKVSPSFLHRLSDSRFQFGSWKRITCNIRIRWQPLSLRSHMNGSIQFEKTVEQPKNNVSGPKIITAAKQKNGKRTRTATPLADYVSGNSSTQGNPACVASN